MPADDTTSIYAEVKAWITQQEAYGAATNTAAPLTNAQRKALEVLRLPIAAPPPPPASSDVDYISLLTRYRQAHPGGGDTGDIRWAEEEASRRAVGGAVGRICRVAINEARLHPEAPVESFPAVGYGLGGKGEDPPVFPRKMQAKQYAAKCATDWLIEHSLMPSNLSDVTFRKGHVVGLPRRDPSPSLSLKRPTGGEGPDNDGDGDGQPPPQKRPARGTAVDRDDGDEPPATQRVTDLCRLLGLQAPRYSITRSEPGVDKYFNGEPDFGHDRDDVPEGLGRVTYVVGSERARQAVAGLVLEHLTSVYRERRGQLEGLSGA